MEICAGSAKAPWEYCHQIPVLKTGNVVLMGSVFCNDIEQELEESGLC